MGKQEIKTIFDVDIKAGDGTNGHEKVIVEPNKEKDTVMSVFLQEEGKPPKKYYDMKIFNNKEFALLVRGDSRIGFIKFEGDKFRYEMPELLKKVDDGYSSGVAAFLDFSFSTLTIEARAADILFKLT